jgi:hypothetical protein
MPSAPLTSPASRPLNDHALSDRRHRIGVHPSARDEVIE